MNEIKILGQAPAQTVSHAPYRIKIMMKLHLFAVVILLLQLFMIATLPAQCISVSDGFMESDIKISAVEYFVPRCLIIESIDNVIVWNIDDSCVDATFQLTPKIKETHYNVDGYIIPIPKANKIAIYAPHTGEGKMCYSIYDAKSEETTSVVPAHNDWPLAYGRCDDTNVIFVPAGKSAIEARNVVDFSLVKSIPFNLERADNPSFMFVTIHPSDAICATTPSAGKFASVYGKNPEQSELFKTSLGSSSNIHAEIHPSGMKCLLTTQADIVVHGKSEPAIGTDTIVSVYDFASSTPQSTFVDASLCGAKFSPTQNNQVLTWTHQGKMYLWDTDSHTILKSFTVPFETKQTLDQDDQQLPPDAMASSEVAELPCPHDLIPCFSSDGTRIIVLTEDMVIYEYCTSSGKQCASHRLDSTFAPLQKNVR